MSLDPYWVNYESCLDEVVRDGHTVVDVIRILNDYWEPSSGEAFNPSGGDRTLPDVLLWERNDWRTVWWDASYYCCLQDSNGDCLTYVEGDIYRGNPKNQQPAKETPA
jgi:hypothetical protein